MPGLRVDGLHAHVGSQVLEAAPYLQTVDTLARSRGPGPRRRRSRAEGHRHRRRVRRSLRRRIAPADGGALVGRARAPGRGRAHPRARGAVARRGTGALARRQRRRHAVSRGRPQDGRRRCPAAAGGRRRHERQRAARAVRRARTPVAVASASRAAERGVVHRGRPPLRVGRHPRRATWRCPRTPGRATCWRSRRRGPTRTRSRAPTTAWDVRRWWPFATASATPWLRREDAADLDRLEVRDRPRARRPGRPRGHRGASRPPRATPAPTSPSGRAVVAEGRSRAHRARDGHGAQRTAAGSATPGATGRPRSWRSTTGGRCVGHLYIQREGHPVTRHVATLGIAVAAEVRGPRHRHRVAVRGAPVGSLGGGREDRALGLPAQHGPRSRSTGRFGFVEEGRLARHSRKSYGDEDEILMAAWIGGRRRRTGAGRRGMSERTIRIGMLGCGTVGAATIRLLHEHADDIAMRAGCRVEVTRVAVRDLDRDRDVPLPRDAFTTDGARDRRRPRDRRGVRGDRRGRARRRPCCCGRSRTGSRWSPPTRNCSPPMARTCSTRPTPPDSTCCSRPRWPAASR